MNRVVSPCRRLVSRIIGLWLLAGAGLPAAMAQDGADAEALFAACVTCHGENAGGNPVMGSPAIAGQLEVYLKRQLVMFRRGIRGTVDGDLYGAIMKPHADLLPDNAAIDALAQWLAALPVPEADAGEVGGDAERGAAVYAGNCIACHGAAGEGNIALKAPRLAGLDTAYLRRQFGNFLSGVRGANPRDRLGRQMASMAVAVEGEDAVEDVLAYIATLPAQVAQAPAP